MSLNVTGCAFRDTTASDGGALHALFLLLAENSTFEDGLARRNGGCISGGSAIFGGVSAPGGQTPVSIRGCRFRNCVARSSIAWIGNRNFYSFIVVGGAVVSSLDVAVADSAFQDCSASSAGGAIYSLRSLTILRCAFFNTSSGSFGGVAAASNFLATPGNVAVTNSSVRLSRAELDGGAFYSENDVVVHGCTFEDVSASRSGGAVFSYRQAGRGPGGGVVAVSDSTFTNVSAGKLGGAVFGSGERTEVSGCTFRNTGAQLGGAVFGSNFTGVEASRFFGTRSAFGGGAVKGAVVRLSACLFDTTSTGLARSAHARALTCACRRETGAQGRQYQSTDASSPPPIFPLRRGAAPLWRSPSQLCAATSPAAPRERLEVPSSQNSGPGSSPQTSSRTKPPRSLGTFSRAEAPSQPPQTRGRARWQRRAGSQ